MYHIEQSHLSQIPQKTLDARAVESPESTYFKYLSNAGNEKELAVSMHNVGMGRHPLPPVFQIPFQHATVYRANSV